MKTIVRQRSLYNSTGKYFVTMGNENVSFASGNFIVMNFISRMHSLRRKLPQRHVTGF